ncbi:zinc finger domain-containing protein [Streptomyces scabiei]|uniref:zinc finger domain-containing protein n=1 Tax=Streptomyces scabiei TaxID=1930 RepID=UPI0029AF3153|nr:hypothetical protein [Streptomyces scabiei]MDX2993359.1 hypothetical protein [Streptomyces scabiei]MDX2993376.1 hypothetical protein [Streptomyces scabiei]MDX3028481.1 hypothetical protein [Streptomyces scabiei]
MTQADQWEQQRPQTGSGELGLRVRAWYRNVACPNCGAAVGRACRTAAGNSTDHHRARRDAAGPLPYQQWREEGVIPPELPAILKDSYAARLQFNIDQPLGDTVAIVRHVLANQLGLVDESSLDRLDDAARALVHARGPVGSADLVTVLATQVARLARHIAGPYDPDAVFTGLIREQVDRARQLQKARQGASE